MCNRLGIRTDNNEEVDLIWIGYLALITKMPSEWELSLNTLTKDKAFQKISYMQPDSHPGDRYFKTMVAYHQTKRLILFEKMNEHS